MRWIQKQTKLIQSKCLKKRRLDIIYIGPVPDLLAVSPNFKGIELEVATGYHCHDSVVFSASGAIDGEVTAGSSTNTMLPVVGL